MKFKEIHGERTYMLPKLRNMFTQKRKEDDDFAREYASHEFIYTLKFKDHAKNKLFKPTREPSN